jgi:hypothetical protein
MSLFLPFSLKKLIAQGNIEFNPRERDLLSNFGFEGWEDLLHVFSGWMLMRTSGKTTRVNNSIFEFYQSHSTLFTKKQMVYNNFSRFTWRVE